MSDADDGGITSVLMKAALAGAVAYAAKELSQSDGSGIMGGVKSVVGSETLSSIAGKAGALSEVASFLSGFFTDSRDKQKDVKATADLAKGAEAFSNFIGGRASVPQTVGDMVQAAEEYRRFKNDLNDGDSVFWASTKALVISKFEGWVAEKVAGLVFSNETPLAEANKKIHGGDGPTVSSTGGSPDHGLFGGLAAAAVKAIIGKAAS